MEKIVCSTLELTAKWVFSLDNYRLKHGLKFSVFAIQHIDQAIPFADICSFL